jgi:hypothetical protein
MYSENLIKAVNGKDLLRARSIIERQINSDRLVESFTLIKSADYAANELKKSGIDLYVADDGEYTQFLPKYAHAKSIEKEHWDKQLWEDLRIAVVYNFSREKVKMAEDLLNHLREQGHSDFQFKNFEEEDSSATEATSNKSKKEQTYSSESKERSNRDYYIGGGAGAILGGGAGAIIGGVGGKLLGFGVAGLVVGAVVGLAVVYYRNNRG